ncbi:DUF1566 domain-containing protein [Pseudoalteromonas sp. SSDWG2]|uniref:Lcl C-terminal domain-containing protein n=1 Tax=Pseudoalteromonas sp. SSDWG2 TaxID=3139391 RepID=UPI003BAD50C5
MINKANLSVSMMALLMLYGCGGSGSDDSDVNQASVNAGQDINAVEKSEVTLSAQVFPQGGTFSWQQLSGPAIEGLPSSEAEIAITLPDVKADTQAQLQVQYRAPDTSLVTDTVMINIVSDNQLPQIVIEQTAPEQLPSQYGDTIVISAAQTTDPDENGHIANFTWQQTAGMSVNATGLDSAEISFVHPLLDENTTLQWTLTVVDDEGGQVSTEYSLFLNKSAQVVIAHAGGDQQVSEFEIVTLDATSSETVRGIFSCYWQQSAGMAVSVADASQCQTTFIAPDIDSAQQLTFDVNVTDDLSRSDTDSVMITVQRKPLGLINDTGMSTCFNNSQSISCGSDDFMGQDAQLGRDSVAERLDKVGRGDMAFDFTKLNQYADELPDDASDFSCVRDNITGLIWEVKEVSMNALPNTSLREAHNHYTWALDGGEGDVVGSVRSAANGTCPSNSDCSIQRYVDEVNATNYCGGSNWRIPTYVELISIIDYQRHGQAQMLSPDFFPNLPDVNVLGHLNYWTSRTSVDGQSLSQAFTIDMRSANDLAYPKANTAYVRLVRNP